MTFASAAVRVAAELSKNPEEITARTRTQRLCQDSAANSCDFSEIATITARSSSGPRSVTSLKAQKVSDDQALRAKKRIESGSSLRRESTRLGVSHVALRKRIAALDVRDPSAPDSLDKAVIQAVLDAGIQGGLSRLSDYTGWTCVELLEAVR